MKELDNETKKKIHKMLGAEKFQKVVFFVEKLKWKAIKNFFPNYLKSSENHLKRQRDAKLEKATTDEEKKINTEYKQTLLILKKEYYTEQNINYHIDMYDPMNMINYSKKNRKIHSSWLKVDAALVPVIIALFVLGNQFAIPLAVITLLEAIKNIECINLQDYNIIQLEEKKDKLERAAQKLVEKRSKRYGEAQEVITKTIDKSEEIPSITQIIDGIDSKEKLEQMRQLLLNEKNRREHKKEMDANKQKKLGGI